MSIIIPVLDSHEIVKRQIKHFEKMDLPDDIDIWFMDDGSDIPITTDSKMENLHIHPTNDKRLWTEEVARNTGAKVSSGEYLLMVDVDYILTKEAIMFCRDFGGEKVDFCRKFGVLDEDGNILSDRETLKEYGLRRKWLPREGLEYLPGHRNNFCMKRKLFKRLGGYKEGLVGKAYPYGGGPDSKFYSKWRSLEKRNRVKTDDHKPLIYFIPNGKYCGSMNYNPFGLFHTLSRKRWRKVVR